MDKPPGVTSARAVAQVKRLLPKKTKIGHTGTLDPLASGLLVLLLGRATRLSRYVTGLDKTYTATARFGAASDTLDAEGEIIELNAPFPDERELRKAAADFTGELYQTPPMASAVKVGGERLYNIHRRGETVERESRPVTVHALDLVSYDPPERSATFHISCTSGTYVRTLIADLSESLHTAAYLTNLRRDSVGSLSLRDAASLESLTTEHLYNRIIRPAAVVLRMPVVEVKGAARRNVCNGREISVPGVSGSFRVEDDGELLAIYNGNGESGRAEVVLCAGS
ncbi:MAG: tRNA pseudouridine(55) synthase TruB [Actinomycetota bacterium]|nr:tRNA pseudouridine(55) synthase TruB [Actinomycetota bacterium]